MKKWDWYIFISGILLGILLMSFRAHAQTTTTTTLVPRQFAVAFIRKLCYINADHFNEPHKSRIKNAQAEAGCH